MVTCVQPVESVTWRRFLVLLDLDLELGRLVWGMLFAILDYGRIIGFLLSLRGEYILYALSVRQN